jgi:hypothetical protein
MQPDLVRSLRAVMDKFDSWRVIRNPNLSTDQAVPLWPHHGQVDPSHIFFHPPSYKVMALFNGLVKLEEVEDGLLADIVFILPLGDVSIASMFQHLDDSRRTVTGLRRRYTTTALLNAIQLAVDEGVVARLYVPALERLIKTNGMTSVWLPCLALARRNRNCEDM